MRVLPITSNLYGFNKSYAARPAILAREQLAPYNLTFTNAWWRKNNKKELASDTVELSKQIELEQSEIIEEANADESTNILKKSKVEEVADIVNEPEIPEIELNANDMILSYRLADVLHRLDDKSLIYIGSNRAGAKSFVKKQLTSEDTFLPNPKNIKNIYAFALGIYEQMENNTFVDKELNDLQYVAEDFKKGIKQ